MGDKVLCILCLSPKLIHFWKSLEISVTSDKFMRRRFDTLYWISRIQNWITPQVVICLKSRALCRTLLCRPLWLRLREHWHGLVPDTQTTSGRAVGTRWAGARSHGLGLLYSACQPNQFCFCDLYQSMSYSTPTETACFIASVRSRYSGSERIPAIVAHLLIGPAVN